jgi:hypothetical protein
MKKIITTPLLCLLLSAGVTSTAMAKDYSLKLSDPSKPAQIEISIMSGSITVQGYKGKTVEISSAVQARSADKHGELSHVEVISRGGENNVSANKRSTAGLKMVTDQSAQINVSERRNKVEIASSSRNKRVNLTIKVPYDTSLNLSVHRGGDIKVSNVTGALELSNHKGAIYAKGVVGPIVAETHKQDIEVSFKSLNQTTPSSLTSHKGNIDISVSDAFKAKVQVQTYKGEIYSGLAVNFKAEDDVSHRGQGSSQEVTIGGLMTAKVNGGGQKLLINTYKGNIYVRKK